MSAGRVEILQKISALLYRMQGLTEELFQCCVCKVTKVCWRAWAGLIQCSCFSTGKHEYYFQSIWNCLKWLFTVVLISKGSDQMEKLKGTKPEKWNNSRERGGPVHTITRFTAAKKHLSHGSLGLNCPAKVVRETPMQTLKLESFLPDFAGFLSGLGCHPVLLTVYFLLLLLSGPT